MQPQGVQCVAPARQYAAAVYWAVMTITSVGYGDIAATPHQPSEQVICSLLMLTGAFVWSQVVATFCGVLATMFPDVAHFRITMDNLNRMIRQEGLPQDLRWRLREYFHRVQVREATSRGVTWHDDET